MHPDFNFMPLYFVICAFCTQAVVRIISYPHHIVVQIRLSFNSIAQNNDDQSLRRQELYFLASKLLFLPGLDSWWCTNFDTN